VRGAEDEQQHRAGFEDYLERDDAVALVAELDGDVCGFVDVEFRLRLNFFEPQAWVPDLVVAEGQRGRGVGRALLARAEELARERGCFSITLESATWRTGAHAFYEREGLSEGGKSFGKVLADVEWPPTPR
jgi:PhnO protein